VKTCANRSWNCWRVSRRESVGGGQRNDVWCAGLDTGSVGSRTLNRYLSIDSPGRLSATFDGQQSHKERVHPRRHHAETYVDLSQNATPVRGVAGQCADRAKKAHTIPLTTQ
jgi:hypothetical protein